jgi:putative FmdB family regulatory protein
MPFYDYRCISCGDFRGLFPMRESATLQPCPSCDVPSERVLCTPFLSGGGPIQSGLGTNSRGGLFSGRRACGHGYACVSSACR